MKNIIIRYLTAKILDGRGVAHNVRQWSALSIIFILCSCHKKTVNRLIEGPIPETRVFVGAGQSNMFLMNLNDGFASEYRKGFNGEVKTVNVARGNTFLSEWQKGSSAVYYGNLITKAKFDGIDALLFWQGENEGLAANTVEALKWKDQFTQFVSDVRSDLGKPNLPIVFVQIGKRYHHGDAWDVVKEQQAMVSIPNVRMVKADEFESLPDKLHFSQEAYNGIGARLANALKGKP